jgi:drug/metabolite transporter (DMT)-like permease
MAKAFERQGIEIFSRKKSFKEKGKKPLIYIIGFILNNTIVIWQLFGTSFSTATVYSSMFGVGLVFLLIYSHYVLKEKNRRIELIGAFLIIIGTTSVGIFQIFEEKPVETIMYSNFIILTIIVGIVLLILFFLFIRFKKGVSLIFGIIAGSLGAIDNVFKRIGLKTGFIEIFNLGTFPILIISFIIGFLAFFFTQYGFAKGAEASKLVPIYNSFYILTPIYFEIIINAIWWVNPLKLVLIIPIIAGLFLMRLFKEEEKLE